MRILVLSDIHGNRVALRAVLAKAPRHDVLLCLGDYLWTSLGNAEIVAWIRRSIERLGENALMVRGNSDAMEHYEAYGSLSREDPRAMYEYLQNLPTEACLSSSGQNLLAVHGFLKPAEFASAFEDRRSLLPWMGIEYVKSVLPLEGVSILVFGDIHLPYLAADRDLLAIDPGSVGFNLDGDPRASFMVLDLRPEGVDVEHHRVSYDNQAAADEVRLAHRDPELGEKRCESFASLMKSEKRPFDWAAEWGRTRWVSGRGVIGSQ